MSELASPRRDWRRELGLTLLAGLFVVGFAFLLVLRDPGYFFHDDMQTGGLPAYYDMARALRSGEWPFLTPYSWAEGCFAGELQGGIFSLFNCVALVAIWLLNLNLAGTSAAYAFIHLAVLGMGSFRLARHMGLPVALSALAMICATLNGWTMAWAASNWVTLLTSFCWLPWAWWALSRAIAPGASPWRVVPAAVFLYLLLAAGWPFTILMMGMVTIGLGLEQLIRRRGPVWQLVVSWAAGVGLAAPAYFMFLENLPETIRGGTKGVTTGWSIPFEGFWGFLVPSIVSIWPVYNQDKGHLPIEVFNGLVPAIAVLVGLAFCFRPLIKRVGWPLPMLAVTLVMIQMPSIINLRWSFRWLPFTHLLMGLVAAWALYLLHERAIAQGHTGWKRLMANPGLWAVIAVALAWGTQPRQPLGPEVPIALLAMAMAWLLAEALLRPESPLRRWAPVALTALALWKVYLHIPNGLSVPTWNMPEAIREPGVFDRNTRYIAVSMHQDYATADKTDKPFGVLLRPSNTAMYAGIEFINGYSPMGPRGLTNLTLQVTQGFLLPQSVRAMTRREAGPGGLLRLWAVDGMVLGASAAEELPNVLRHGWRVVAQDHEATVLHREGPPSPLIRSIPGVQLVPTFQDAVNLIWDRPGAAVPLVLVEPTQGFGKRPYAPAEVRLVSTARGRHVAEVRNLSKEAPALVSLARPWYPGYRARLDGRDLPVKTLNISILAVELPPGAAGRLEFVYWPRSLELGLASVGVTLLGLPLLLGYLNRRRLRAPSDATPAPASPAAAAS